MNEENEITFVEALELFNKIHKKVTSCYSYTDFSYSREMYIIQYSLEREAGKELLDKYFEEKKEI